MSRTSLVKLPSIAGFSNIYWKDESSQPTGTFKDRLIRTFLERVREPTMVSCISYGNTAISLAHHLRIRRNLKIRPAVEGCVIVPDDLRDWRLGPSTSGAWLAGRHLVDYLSESVTVVPLSLGERILREKDIVGIVHANVAWDGNIVDITEGFDIPAYGSIVEEAIEQLGCFPDVCVLPYGAGILANEVGDVLATADKVVHIIPLSVADRTSSARMLFGPVWLDVEQLRSEGVAQSRHHSPDRTGRSRPGYPVYLVNEDQVHDGLEIAKRLGLSCEPSAAVGLGYLAQLRNLIPEMSDDSRILVIGTGDAINKFNMIRRAVA